MVLGHEARPNGSVQHQPAGSLQKEVCVWWLLARIVIPLYLLTALRWWVVCS